MRIPPPQFSVVPAGRAIRVLAFGDFGTGSAAQKQTAAAMVAYQKIHPFDFGLTLGDNFYPRGMKSPDDPRWQTQWEQLYGVMHIPFYAVLGNHDWSGADSPAAEILYSARSQSWHMPSPYYTFTAGSVQFFAFDTPAMDEAELKWLDEELIRSTARWKVVFGHYHIYSATRGDNKELIARLLPILKKDHVDVYLDGHDHNLQELKPEGGVHFFVSGGGGAGLYEMNPYDRSVFRQKINGFTVLEADDKTLAISFVGTDGSEIYRRTLTK
ncbi:metallophosphoesterase [Paracidobacterium acidisoli]|nr:metallophosphoesterase [Paracidobacterium acidisoli]